MRHVTTRSILRIVVAGCVAVSCASAFGQDSPSEAAERRRLQDSYDTSCRQFVGDDHWREADTCRRAWFSEHEEAVWRLKLNPHGREAGPPS